MVSHLPFSPLLILRSLSFLIPKDSPLLQPSSSTQPSLFVKKAKYSHNHYRFYGRESSSSFTKIEIQWLLGNVQPSRGYERKIRYSINRKITTLTKLELPLLASRGFNVTIHCNSVTTHSNAPRGSAAAVGCGVANPAGKVHDIREEDKEHGAGSGTFVPPSGSISNPRVLSDMGLAIPRPTRLGDPRPHLKQLQLTLY